MGAGASVQVSKDKIKDLSVEEVGGLLKDLGYPQYVDGVSKMGVDGSMLGDLDDAKFEQIIPNEKDRAAVKASLANLSSAAAPAKLKLDESAMPDEDPLATKSPKEQKAANKLKRANSTHQLTAADPEYWGPDRVKLRSSKKKQKTVRVFLSSTFRDFMRERNYLFTEIFPKLQTKCAERGIFFIPIDLRWGVTAEESGRGDVIKLCLQEIDGCAPFFVCMLGERYGWHQTAHGADDLLQKTFDVGAQYYQWVREYETASATEAEIRHAFLNDPKSMPYSFFYFRDPEFPSKHNLPADEAKGYFAWNEYAQGKQHELQQLVREEVDRECKRRARANDDTLKAQFVTSYDYEEVEELGQKIGVQLWEAIQHEFPKSENLTEVMKSRLPHEAFADMRLRYYVSERRLYELLRTAVNNSDEEGQNVLVKGPGGCGKQALIINFRNICTSQEEPRHPVLKDTDTSKWVFFEHYLGTTTKSTTRVNIHSRMFAELDERYSIMSEIPTDSQELANKYEAMLQSAAAAALAKGERIIIMLGGLQRLKHKDRWLSSVVPSHIPRGMTFLYTYPGTEAPPSLRDRSPQEIQVPLLNEETKTHVIKKFLSSFGKKLAKDQLDMVVVSEVARNPLFLVTFLEEIRTFGVYEKLTGFMQELLGVSNVKGLFMKFIERLEQAYSKKNVQDFFCAIACSKDGLKEEDLLKLLEWQRAGDYTSLKYAVDKVVFDQNSFLSFVHEHIESAVRDHYLKDAAVEKEWHTRLAAFFQAEWDEDKDNNKIANSLKLHLVSEISYQLEQCEKWAELSKHIGDLQVFVLLQDEPQERFLMMNQWNDLLLPKDFSIRKIFQENIESFKKKQRLRMAAELEKAAQKMERELDSPKSEDFHNKTEVALSTLLLMYLKKIAAFFVDMARYDDARLLYRKVQTNQKMIDGGSEDGVKYALSCVYLARVEEKLRHNIEALKLFEKALPIIQGAVTSSDSETATVETDMLVVMANLYSAEGQYGKALEMSGKALGIQEKKLAANPNNRGIAISVANALNDMGTMLFNQKKLEDALDKYERCLKLTVSFLGREHVDVAKTLANLALVLKTMGGEKHTHGALVKYQEALKLLRRLKGENHPEVATVMMNLAIFYSQQLRKPIEALELAEKALKVQQEIFGPNAPTMSGNYMNLGNIRVAVAATKKDIRALPAALDCYSKAIAITESNDKNNIALAEMHMIKGRLCLRMKLRQECVSEFNKAVAVLDAQPDPSKEGPKEKKIRGFAKKVQAQMSRSVSTLQSRENLGAKTSEK